MYSKLSKMVLLVTIVIFVACWNFKENRSEKKMSELALANVEALAADEYVHGSGDVPNKRCPIWNVSYTESWGGPSVSCSTGGAYKCASGECPHGS